MPRFFVGQDAILGDEILLTGENAHHIARSLRMAANDPLTVCDGQGTEYDCRILSFLEDREVRARILSRKEQGNEPPCRIRLFQALPKGDKLETVIQKAVECGAAQIIPFESERCVVRMKPEAEGRKTERRCRIAEEAAKQCGRSLVPTVLPTVSFEEALRLAAESEICLFCYEGEGTVPLGQILRQNRSLLERGCSLSVMVGSEGGFSNAEAEAAKKAGMYAVGLGRRILRTETAPVFVLSCLCLATELGG